MPGVFSNYTNNYQIGILIENLDLKIPDFMVNTLKN